MRHPNAEQLSQIYSVSKNRSMRARSASVGIGTHTSSAPKRTLQRHLCRERGPAITHPAEATDAQPGGNLEGKEVRFGVGGSVLAAITTSNGATGSYNSMHDSYTPLGGMVPLVNMLLGEIVFGGLGTGLYSIVLVALLGLFLTGMIVGRTPDYLGKKIGPAETRLITIYTLIGPLAILTLTALAVRVRIANGPISV